MSATPPKAATTRYTRVFRKRIQVMRRAMVVSSRPGTPRTDAFRTEQQLPHRLNAIEPVSRSQSGYANVVAILDAPAKSHWALGSALSWTRASMNQHTPTWSFASWGA